MANREPRCWQIVPFSDGSRSAYVRWEPSRGEIGFNELRIYSLSYSTNGSVYFDYTTGMDGRIHRPKILGKVLRGVHDRMLAVAKKALAEGEKEMSDDLDRPFDEVHAEMQAGGLCRGPGMATGGLISNVVIQGKDGWSIELKNARIVPKDAAGDFSGAQSFPLGRCPPTNPALLEILRDLSRRLGPGLPGGMQQPPRDGVAQAPNHIAAALSAIYPINYGTSTPAEPTQAECPHCREMVPTDKKPCTSIAWCNEITRPKW